MSVIDRGLDGLSFLPDALREALHRRLRELSGLALIALALLLTFALATWSVQDPSFSHATNTAVRNVLGVPGATVADLMCSCSAWRRLPSFFRSRSGAGGCRTTRRL